MEHFSKLERVAEIIKTQSCFIINEYHANQLIIGRISCQSLQFNHSLIRTLCI